MKLIVAVGLALVMVSCASNSMPKGFYMSPFIIVDKEPSPPSQKNDDDGLPRRSTSSQ